jgi:hypothetical protein
VPGIVDTSVAHTSDQLFMWAVFAYAVAMLGYAAEFAFTRLASARGESTARAERLGRVAVALTVVGWLLHVG